MVAPEALCTDRRTGMLDLYLAGPLDVHALPGRQVGGGRERDARDDRRPAALPARGVRIEGKGPSATGTPLLLLKILAAGIGVALFYTAVAMAVSSLTTRRAVAAVAIVLLLLVPSIVGRRSRSRAAARLTSSRCSLRSTSRPSSPGGSSATAASQSAEAPPIASVSTGLVVAGLAGWIALGAAVCWVSYRRQARRR